MIEDALLGEHEDVSHIKDTLQCLTSIALSFMISHHYKDKSLELI